MLGLKAKLLPSDFLLLITYRELTPLENTFGE